MNHQDIHFIHSLTTEWTMETSHTHELYEINLSISGGNRFFVNDRCYDAKKGDLFFFSPSDIHKNHVPIGIPYDRFLFFFSRESVADFMRDHPTLLELFHGDGRVFGNRLSLEPDEFMDLHFFLTDTIHILKTQRVPRYLFSQIKGIEFLLRLEMIYKKRIVNKQFVQSENDRGLSQKVGPVIAYINHNYHQPISIDSLAHRFHLNRSYLCKLFRSETGFSINEFLTAKRITVSRQLLQDGLTVQEVSEKVGYHHVSYFIRVFKQIMKVTPKQYLLEKQR